MKMGLGWLPQNRLPLPPKLSPKLERSWITESKDRENNALFSGPSALSGHFAAQSSCPLYPQKQTYAVRYAMSALGQKQTSNTRWRCRLLPSFLVVPPQVTFSGTLILAI